MKRAEHRRPRCLAAVMAGALLLCGCAAPSPSGAAPSGTTAPAADRVPVEMPDANSPDDGKRYAADSFFDENGGLATSSTDNLTIGFIGGSLTEGDISYDAELSPHCANLWTDRVLEYFSQTFPRRYIRAYNAGISATTSDFGAARFRRCILDYAPDIVFIEYAVNDAGWGQERAQAYMEAMVMQARSLEKVPVIIFVYNPQPSDKNTAAYAAWRAGVDFKEEIAAYHGIGTVNVYDYLYDDCTAGGYGSFSSYLGRFFNLYSTEEGGSYYDVHPRANGYEMYGDAVVTAISSSPEKYLCRLREVGSGYGNGLYDRVTGIDYHHIAPDSDLLTYTGDWNFYDSVDSFNAYATLYGASVAIPLRSYATPYNEDGIAQTLRGGASVSFTSSAAGLCVQFIYASAGNTASVYVDGRYAATVSCHRDFYGYTGAAFLELPNDGKDHEIRLVTNPVSDGYAAFRFGYLIELREN